MMNALHSHFEKINTFDKPQTLILRIDLANPEFEIRTPLVYMTKRETLEFAHRLNVLEFLLEETVTCYQGLTKKGCGLCPACELRNQGIAEYLLDHPELEFSYRAEFAPPRT
jgi:7-cyano-7-deazaguanine synthase